MPAPKLRQRTLALNPSYLCAGGAFILTTIQGSTSDGPETHPPRARAEPTAESSRTQARVLAPGLHLGDYWLHGDHGLRGGANQLHVSKAGRPRPHRGTRGRFLRVFVLTAEGAVTPSMNNPALARCWRGDHHETRTCWLESHGGHARRCCGDHLLVQGKGWGERVCYGGCEGTCLTLRTVGARVLCWKGFFPV